MDRTHRRAHLQHAERQWHQQPHRARAVYWPLRYTPPPPAPRPGRVLAGALLMLCGLGLGALGAIDAIPRDASMALFGVDVLVGLYLVCTTHETDQ